MAYTKQTWANGSGGGTPISATRLNHMEDGIASASTGGLTKNADGFYEFTAVTGGGGADTTAPSVPSGLASSAITTTGFTLSWSASTDAVGVTSYEISTDNGTSVATTATTTSKAITGLTAGTLYQVKVRAKDAAGNASAYSSALPVTTTSSVPSPTSDFDFHEGSGSTAASTVGSFALTAADSSTAWSGNAAVGTFQGDTGPSGTTTNWTVALDVNITYSGSGPTSMMALFDVPHSAIMYLNISGSGATAPALRPGPYAPDQFGSVAIPSGTPSRVVFVFNPTDSRVYVDGALSGTFATVYAITMAGLAPQLLATAAIVVDRVRFWTVDLTAGQVAALT